MNVPVRSYSAGDANDYHLIIEAGGAVELVEAVLE